MPVMSGQQPAARTPRQPTAGGGSRASAFDRLAASGDGGGGGPGPQGGRRGGRGDGGGRSDFGGRGDDGGRRGSRDVDGRSGRGGRGQVHLSPINVAGCPGIQHSRTWAAICSGSL